MGMYTEFRLNVSLKKDTPSDIIRVLHYMANSDDAIDFQLPDHEFFKCQRWSSLFLMSSAYFDTGYPSLSKDNLFSNYNLSVHSSLKNYDGEIRKFMNWIMPYINAENHEILGYHKYEEDDKSSAIVMGSIW